LEVSEENIHQQRAALCLQFEHDLNRILHGKVLGH